MLFLLGCSDYDLNKGSGGVDGGDTPDHRPPKEDTIITGDSDPPVSDSATDTVPSQDVPSGKIDVVLLVDVAYVYDCYHAEVANHTSELVTALLSSGADVSIAIATFDDYNVDGEWWSRNDGNPYELLQQLTDNESRLQSAAGTLSIEWGGDGAGSGYEALLQATTGLGYDQDCDEHFDASADVRPYEAKSGDAFHGNAGGVADSSTPGTGSTAGVGFRTGSKRVIVLFAENVIRDRGEGHDLPVGACPGVASRSDAITGIRDVDAKFLGVNAYEFQDIDSSLQGQLEDIASSTSSRIDSDGDGARDDVAVFSGDWEWPTTDRLVAAIWDLAR